MIPSRRETLTLMGMALLVAVVVAAGVPGPAYTDAYYYFNAGHRLATGEGLTDPYVALTYIGAPDALPAPSHTYWMPLVSLLVALGGGSFRVAQILFVILWVLLALVAFWLGGLLGGSRRHAWAAGLLTVFCGYYAPLMVTTDAFAPFGLAGALSLLAMGWGRLREDWRWFVPAGALAALTHLARADGLLLMGVLVLAAIYPGRWLARNSEGGKSSTWKVAVPAIGGGVVAYLVVMLPWFLRNMRVIGTPLPVGGTATMWLRGYNELVSYPPTMSLSNFLHWGAENILKSRWTAFTNNLGTFVAVEGLIVLAPLIVLALVKRWRNPLLLPVWIYAILLHLAMTFAFAYPGYRGGLFHSAAALLPWWMAAGILGLDDAVDWVARRRRTWRPAQAKRVFTAGVLALALLLTLSATDSRRGETGRGAFVDVAQELLPRDAVVMSNDPAALYYFTGMGGVVVPDGDLVAVRALVDRYGITHILLDENYTLPLRDLYEGRAQPDFLRLIEQDVAPTVRLYEVVR